MYSQFHKSVQMKHHDATVSTGMSSVHRTYLRQVRPVMPRGRKGATIAVVQSSLLKLQPMYHTVPAVQESINYRVNVERLPADALQL